MTRRVPTQTPKKRAAGRPTEERGVGETRIIEATKSLLRTRMPAEITVVEVAAEAHVDPALIRYYFKNKQGLIRSTALQIMDEIQSRSEAMFMEKEPLAKRLEMRLKMLIEVLTDNPRFLQLVLNEIYRDDGTAGRKETLEDIANRGLHLSEALLKRREGDPVIRDVDARFLHISLLGLCTFFMDAHPLVSSLFGEKADLKKVTEDYIQFAAQLILRGITVTEGETG